MEYIAVTLFDHPAEAQEGMGVLRDNGFDPEDLEVIESDPESQNFFKRAFTKKGGEEFKADQAMGYLTELGIDESDAKRYAKKVKKGLSLVITRCDSESQAERARRLLEEYPFGEEREQLKTEPPAEHLGTERTGGPKQPGYESAPGTAHVEQGEYDRESAARPERSAEGAGDELETPAVEEEPQEEFREPTGYSVETGETGAETEFVETTETTPEAKHTETVEPGGEEQLAEPTERTPQEEYTEGTEPGPRTGRAEEEGIETPGTTPEERYTETETADPGPRTGRAEEDVVKRGETDVEEFTEPPLERSVEFDEETLGVEQMSRRAASRFEEFEDDYRHHYEEYLADTGLSFDDCSRGYRYGMALGRDETLKDYDWETVEPEAGRQWESQEASSWDDFKEAVRYGFYKIRGREDEYERRFPR